MTSGIRFLADHHRLHRRPTRRVISSYTASLPPPSTPQPIPNESVTEEERTKLEEALVTYHLAESDPDDDHKDTLWPLFHYLLWQDIASEDTSQEARYAAYAAANQPFAERIKSVWRPGHLLLPRRAGLLRVLIPDAHDSLVIGRFVRI